MKQKSILKEIFKNIFWTLAKIIPIKQNLIILESNYEFQDNAKALYLKMMEMNLNQNYEIKYLVKNKKLISQGFSSENFVEVGGTIGKIRQAWYYMRAKYCFYTHHFLGIRRKSGQIRVFLTHGVPLKNSTGQFGPASHHTNIISTSEFSAKLRVKTFFDEGLEKVLNLGFPRNDSLIGELKNEIQLPILKEKEFNKIIVWLPTFKRMKNSQRNDFSDDRESDISIISKEFFTELNTLLKKKKILLLIKFHPNQDLSYIEKINFENIVSLTNKELLKTGTELYDLLNISDALITDYSSVYIDYLLCDKPIAFELGDFESYLKGRGFLVENPLDYMPGSKLYSSNDFLNFIEDVEKGRDEFSEQRQNIKNLFHENQDENSAERIIKYFNLK